MDESHFHNTISNFISIGIKINIISNDIQYKEGIIEILEKNKNVQYIIINENLFGQIKIEKLINKIKNINNKINILIILNKKDFNKEKYLIDNQIKFIYAENLTAEKILEIIFNKNKIIAISGTEGIRKNNNNNDFKRIINRK